MFMITETKNLTEAKTTDDGKLYIEGIFMQAEVKNKNGRVYPLAILKKAVDEYRAEKIDTGMAWGELEHPPTPNIDSNNVCIRIVELNQKGNDFIGKALVTDTAKGEIVKGLLKSGGRVGVSSRGLGKTKMESGTNVIQEGFRLVTAADVVLNPSAPDAFVDGLMESAKWVYENGIWKEEDLDEAKEQISEAQAIDLEAVKIDVFKKFMGSL